LFTRLTKGVSHFHHKEGPMGEAIDRKFKFEAVSLSSGKAYSQKNAIVFLARDPAVPAALEAYEAKCKELGASDEQLQGVGLLHARVVQFQTRSLKRVKVADVQPGKEAKRVLKPNKVG